MSKQDTTSDDELVATARRRGPKGEAAFALLVRKHQHWLVRYLLYLLGNRQDAEDVAQESLVRAYLAIATLEKGGSFRSWRSSRPDWRSIGVEPPPRMPSISTS
jgi:hypothetical protein